MTFETMISIEERISDQAVAGLPVGTMVLTTEGALPVQFLAPGDRVITRSGATLLKDIEVTLLRGAEMIRISVSALGHDRPENDLFIAPDQQVTLRDWRAQALYDKPVATVEAARLVDGEYIRREDISEIRVFTLRFERDESIFACGMELVCKRAGPED
ncbi:Hint domain-containing protein [Pseudogemmobacter faecipullorum]|uniref:Hint domain-containing protein n=1 Tax=Pseudogemmobacter faecipullorum TaxID=2755041 RepID=A0ABS8CLC9_9RHOB|nr:Hint domain-containing protein [Pseudogemmobacter faecipullorum]MCB5409993.1 Hint domain-containing protein [Pseudogemmobacter faecipullorum]